MPSSLPPPPGKLLDVGGHRLHLYPSGEGSPTVVFESGGESWSLDWHLVQQEVAKFTCACSYDRAGFGWSDPGPKPRTGAQIAGELHALLEAAGLARPYILVGASFGGHPVRLFAHKYPHEVAGVVLLDARHEAVGSKMPPAWKQMELAGKGRHQVMLLLSRLKLLKVFGSLMGEQGMPPVLSKLPPDLRQTYLEVGYQPKYFESNLDELAACAESDRQAQAAGDLGDMPLVVIRHGIPDLFSRMPAGLAEEAEQTWQQLQAELSRLSSNSRMLVAENSGHFIQFDQPELVVDVIRQMVGMARAVEIAAA